MAKKIYMTNLKGGAGVTTCCVGLGIALANAGERTLIVDGDCDCACALQICMCTLLQTTQKAGAAQSRRLFHTRK